MSNRLAAGFTLAGFPLTGAMLAVTAGNFCLAALLLVPFAAMVGATVAPRVGWLHKLPVVGSPRLTMDFKANGSVEFREDEPQEVMLAAPEEAFPLTVLVEVGVHNHGPSDVTHALVNIGAKGVRALKRCDGWGEEDERGQLMPRTGDGYDYWAIRDERFTRGDAFLLHIRFRIPGPGTYPIFAAINSNELYEEVPRHAAIRVVSQDYDELSMRDRVSLLINEGEALYDQAPDAFSEDSLRKDVAGYLVKAAMLLAEEDQALHDQFNDAEADWGGPQTGSDYLRSLLRAKVRELYVISDELGRR